MERRFFDSAYGLTLRAAFAVQFLQNCRKVKARKVVKVFTNRLRERLHMHGARGTVREA